MKKFILEDEGVEINYKKINELECEIFDDDDNSLGIVDLEELNNLKNYEDLCLLLNSITGNHFEKFNEDYNIVNIGGIKLKEKWY